MSIALSLDETEALLLLLTEPVSKAVFDHIKAWFSQSLLEEKERTFDISGIEKNALLNILNDKKEKTDDELSCYLSDLSEIPGRWWEKFGYPPNHKIARFCECLLCNYFYYRVDQRFKQCYPGEILLEENETHRLSALGKLEKFDVKRIQKKEKTSRVSGRNQRNCGKQQYRLPSGSTCLEEATQIQENKNSEQDHTC